ncbi:MAG: diacylglycerol/lipid kinase family protein [bacterium]
MKLNNVLIIYNPKAGRFSEKKLAFIKNFLKKKNIEYRILDITSDYIDKDTASRFDAILVAAGDGSLNYVINHFIFTDIPIAHLPMGTVNLFALENKTPYSLKKALDEILNIYKPVKINLGKANERYFISMTGVGLDAFIVKNMEGKIRTNKKRLYNNTVKYLNYIFNIIKISGNYKFRDISVRINGVEDYYSSENFKRFEKHNLKEIIVSNIRYYGGPFKVFPENSPLNDNFDIRLVNGVNGTIDVVFSILKSLTLYKKYGDNPDFYLKADKIYIFSPDPSENKNIFYQCDGEFAGTLPVEIEKVRGAITMLVNPASFL